MNARGFLGDVALRVDEAVVDPPGRKVIVQFKTADLDDPVAGGGIEARRLRIEDDFPHL